MNERPAAIPMMLSARARILLSILAFLGTAAYASSFAIRPDAPRLFPIAMGIGISAGLSWMVLGHTLIFLSRGDGRRLMHWFDTCLIAMSVGECILLLAAAVNTASVLTGAFTASTTLHLALLIAADIAMAITFTLRARRFGIPVRTTLALWIGVLNGSFAIFLLMLARPLGYA